MRSARSPRWDSTDPLLWLDRAEPELRNDSSEAADIADPIDGDRAVYDHIYAQIEQGVRELVRLLA